MKTIQKIAGLFWILCLFFGSAGCSEHTISRESQTHFLSGQNAIDESGEVRGKIADFKNGTVVTLENDLTLFTCHPDPFTGEFRFAPVEPDTYSLHVYEAESINPCSIRGIVVRPNEIVNLGSLQIVL